MAEFDVYAFADYSGATGLQQQRKHIVLATLEAGVETDAGRERFVESEIVVAESDREWSGSDLHGIAVPVGQEISITAHTRESLLVAVQDLLAEAERVGKRVIFGFDHSYSFPGGFYETITGQRWERWEQLLGLLVEGVEELPGLAELPPRQWAEKVNDLIGQRFCIETGGPFWGSHFSQLRDPRFPYAETPLRERRLVEERCRRMKPIYKIGGAGAVGLQALYGITYIARLREYCRSQGIPLFAWPFDGWEVPEQGHLLVEIYPTLYNQGARTDAEDAKSCALWLAHEDRAGTLGKWFHPVLSAEEKARVQLEGWVLGVE